MYADIWVMHCIYVYVCEVLRTLPGLRLAFNQFHGLAVITIPSLLLPASYFSEVIRICLVWRRRTEAHFIYILYYPSVQWHLIYYSWWAIFVSMVTSQSHLLVGLGKFRSQMGQKRLAWLCQPFSCGVCSFFLPSVPRPLLQAVFPHLNLYSSRIFLVLCASSLFHHLLLSVLFSCRALPFLTISIRTSLSLTL